MSLSVSAPPPSLLSPANAVTAPGSTLAGLAAMAPVLVASAQSLTFPTTLAGWLQVALGVLAVFSRA